MTPFPQSYWVVDGVVCAGQYPGDKDPAERAKKLAGLVACGIRRVVSLMKVDERSPNGRPFEPYEADLSARAAAAGITVEYIRHPIPDAHAPTAERMHEIQATIRDSLAGPVPTYLHCFGGHGRTGTAVACHLIDRGATPAEAIRRVHEMRAALPKSHDPFEGDQVKFIRAWPPR